MPAAAAAKAAAESIYQPYIDGEMELFELNEAYSAGCRLIR